MAHIEFRGKWYDMPSAIYKVVESQFGLDEVEMRIQVIWKDRQRNLDLVQT